jgi:hypothetical protein
MKIKDKKLLNRGDDRSTIEEKFNKKVEEIKNNYNTLQKKLKQLEQHKKSTKRNTPEIKTKISNLTKEIEHIKSTKETDINKFLLSQTNLIQNYHQEVNRSSISNSNSEDTSENGVNTNDTFFQPQVTKNLSGIYDDFMKDAYGKYSDKKRLEGSKNKNMCPDCNEELVEMNNLHLACEICGVCYDRLIDNTQCSLPYGEFRVDSKYTYKEIVHFTDCLNRFQGKERIKINDNVKNVIAEELQKHNIKKMSQITHSLVKRILKKRGLSDYSDHIPLIINMMFGVPPPQLDIEFEKQLVIDFEKKILISYRKFRPEGRHSFLNYNYTLYKMFELYEQDHLLKCFPPPDDEQKVREYDKVWKKICDDLNWEFYPTHFDGE